MGQIGVGIVGAGFMGPAHVEALRRLGMHITGILGIDANESKAAAAKLNLPRAYESLEELLADPAVTSVHIAAPNKHHYSIACLAIEAGKHVLCEKPLAMNSDESADLVARAAKSGLKCGVNYNMRFYPVCQEARERIRSGKLGRIYGIQGSYTQDWLLLESDYNWRLLREEGGALRAIADVGTHWMDLVTSITGLKPVEVFADLQTVHPIRRRPLGEVETFSGKMGAGDANTEPVEIETEDQGSVLVRFDNGARGCLWVSQVTAGRKNCLRFELSAKNGAFFWNSESPNELWMGRRDKANEILVKDPSLMGCAAQYANGFPGGHQEGYPDTFKTSFRAFYDAIEGKTPVVQYATFEDGHREVLFCESVLCSAAQNRWIRVE